jgi:hypothetical protein
MVMTDPAFALHLGNGVYLDGDGNIHHGPAPAAIIYEAEFKLPIDPKKAADAFKSVSDAFKDVDDVNKSKEVIDKITKIYGFFFGDKKVVDAKALLKMLSTISKIAGTVAPVLLVAGFAIDVFRMFGFFNDGPSALEKLAIQRFKDLDDEFQVLSQLLHGKDMVTGLDAIHALIADATDYVKRLGNINPNPAQQAGQGFSCC